MAFLGPLSAAHPLSDTMIRLLLLLPLLLLTARAQSPSEKDLERYPLAPVLDPLQDDRLFRDSRIGIQVVNARSGEEVYAYHADEGYIPASVMKILTAAVALRTLGPSWRFTTAVMRGKDVEIDDEGTLKGDLYVWGGGDPTLLVQDLWILTRDLRLAGVAKIEGNVVFDGTYFDDEPLIQGWNKGTDIANGPSYFAPLSALTVNFNSTTLIVYPAANAGDPARIELETPVSLITIENKVTTGTARSRPWMTIEREADWTSGEVKFTLEGNIPVTEEEPWRYYRAVAAPAPHFAAIFRSMLDANGIAVEGRTRYGKTPRESKVLVRHQSQPLNEVLSHMNKLSSNIIAEQVLKAVGAEVHGAPGTTDKGLQAVAAYLHYLGIPEAEYHLVNGSGLSRDQVLRPTHLTAVLLDMYHNYRLSSEFMSTLAVGGQDGTLRHRFQGERAGRVRAKTGSVNGVFCLTGYIEGGDGETYAFAFLVNDFERSSRAVRLLQDRFGASLIDMSTAQADGAAGQAPGQAPPTPGEGGEDEEGEEAAP